MLQEKLYYVHRLSAPADTQNDGNNQKIFVFVTDNRGKRKLCRRSRKYMDALVMVLKKLVSMITENGFSLKMSLMPCWIPSWKICPMYGTTA